MLEAKKQYKQDAYGTVANIRDSVQEFSNKLRDSEITEDELPGIGIFKAHVDAFYNIATTAAKRLLRESKT